MLHLLDRKSLVGVAVLLLLLVCCCNYSPVQAKYYLCGRDLDEALSLACKQGFRRKLPYNNAAQRNLLPLQYKRKSSFFFFANHTTNQPSLLMLRRARRHIVDECCRQYCPESTLHDYCL